MQTNRKLRKILNIGQTKAVTIPVDWIETDFAWISLDDDKIIIEPIEIPYTKQHEGLLEGGRDRKKYAENYR